jgi:hypothetical protein
MSEKFSITNSTTVSVGILLTVVGGTFFIARLEAASNQNSKDITALTDSIGKRIEVDERQNDINQKLNENIIRLNARLDVENDTQQDTLPVTSATPLSKIVVVNSSGMQPTSHQQNPVQPAQTPPPGQEPDPTPEPSTPEDEPEENPGAAEMILNTILRVVRL